MSTTEPKEVYGLYIYSTIDKEAVVIELVDLTPHDIEVIKEFQQIIRNKVYRSVFDIALNKIINIIK